MLGAAEVVAFVPSTDLVRSERFYVDVLGLEPVDRSPYASELRCGSTTVRVTKVDELRPQPFTVLGWSVPDLRSVVAQARARDVDLLRYDGLGQDDDGVWTTPTGDLVAWFPDPDGNVLSLTQLSGP